MSINTKDLLTDPKRFFLEPSTSAQRQYEALRGFFIEELPSAEAAQRFGYTPGSFRVLVHDFRHDPAPQFFIAPQRGPDSAPKSDPLRERIITLRKQNFSIYDIRDLLREEGQAPGTSTIAAILKDEGFSKLPRRGDDERMEAPRPLPADAAKIPFLTEYSCRVPPSSYPHLMKRWFDEVGKLGLERGVSFNLDFHTIPFHGEDALLEKHDISKRSRRQKGLLAFIAQEEENQVFCYTNADLRQEEQHDAVLRCVAVCKEKTGKVPEELIFDSRLTTYANLDKLNAMNIKFMTLRRRTKKLLSALHEL